MDDLAGQNDLIQTRLYASSDGAVLASEAYQSGQGLSAHFTVSVSTIFVSTAIQTITLQAQNTVSARAGVYPLGTSLHYVKLN
jgi:hypothetical protein